MDETAIRKVLARYGLALRPRAAVEVIEGGNQTATIDTDDGRVIVRCSHPTRTRQWLQMEAEVLAYLRQVGYPAVRQRRTTDGRPVVEAGGRLWSVFDWVEGRTVDPPSDAQLAELARLHAKLHESLAAMPGAGRHAEYAASFRARKSWAYLVPLAATGRFVAEMDMPGRLAAAADRREHAAVLRHLAECRRRIDAAVAALAELPGQLAHYDFSQYNVLFAADGQATVIDFDLLIWDSAAADVARAINAVARFGFLGPLLPVKAAAYLRAYQAVRSLGEAELAALPSLLRLYVLQYPVFHALMYLEATDMAWQARWAQAVGKDLARDEELSRLGSEWIAAAAG